MYAVTAIFAPIFLIAKERIKKLLVENILYTDGLRPDEISSYLSCFKSAEYFYENDLEQQDVHTDQPIIEVEFALYKLLGVSESV